MDFLAGKVQGARDAAASAAGEVRDSAAWQKMESVTDDIRDTDAFKKLEAIKEEKMRELEEFERAQKRKIAAMVYQKLDGVFEHGMTVVNTRAKQEMYDPYMPNFVYGMMTAVFDAIFPDLKNEVKSMILSGLAGTPLYHGESPCCRFSPVALMRYWLLPYDRNIWRKIRNPFWWLFTIASVFPRFNAPAVTFTFYFLLIDKNDEFQLQEFILSFKALQFISLGIASACTGSVQYFLCTTMDPPNCDEWAPREELFTIGLFVWQIILVWIAFALLGRAKAKGGDFYNIQGLSNVEPEELSLEYALVHENLLSATAVSDNETRVAAKRRLRNFLIYDFVVFVLCIALFLWLAFYFQLDPDASITRHEHGYSLSNWKFSSGLYWIKVFYGMMSFPFILLKVPGLSTVISHARPTGYNPYGNTVRYLGVEEDGPLPWDPSRPTKEEREAHEKEQKRMAAKEAQQREPIAAAESA